VISHGAAAAFGLGVALVVINQQKGGGTPIEGLDHAVSHSPSGDHDVPVASARGELSTSSMLADGHIGVSTVTQVTQDGGLGTLGASGSECVATFLRDSRALFAFVEESQRRSVLACLATVRGAIPSEAPAPREPCGSLSEELWSTASGEIESLLRIAGGAGENALVSNLFADVDCVSMSDNELGYALQVASRSPRWIAPAFIECVLRRETEESLALWTALDVASAHPAHRWSFVSREDWQDQRTLRRIGRLSEAARPARVTERSDQVGR